MAKKTPELSLDQELRALDHKDRNFRQNLPEHLRGKFSPYLMLRYAASVSGSADLQRYYLQATNDRVNRDFFSVKDPELQWLACTTVSPDLGTQRHYWIGAAKKSDSQKKHDALREMIAECLPTYKESEIDLFMSLNTEEDLEQWLQDQGLELPSRK